MKRTLAFSVVAFLISNTAAHPTSAAVMTDSDGASPGPGYTGLYPSGGLYNDAPMKACTLEEAKTAARKAWAEAEKTPGGFPPYGGVGGGGMFGSISNSSPYQGGFNSAPQKKFNSDDSFACQQEPCYSMGDSCFCNPKAADAPCTTSRGTGICAWGGTFCQTECITPPTECYSRRGTPESTFKNPGGFYGDPSTMQVVGGCAYHRLPDGTACSRGVCSEGQCIDPNQDENCQTDEFCVHKPGIRDKNGKCVFVPYADGTNCQLPDPKRKGSYLPMNPNFTDRCYSGVCTPYEKRPQCLHENPCMKSPGRLVRHTVCQFDRQPDGYVCGQGMACKSGECEPDPNQLPGVNTRVEPTRSVDTPMSQPSRSRILTEPAKN